jgi:hypothetical protein
MLSMAHRFWATVCVLTVVAVSPARDVWRRGRPQPVGNGHGNPKDLVGRDSVVPPGAGGGDSKAAGGVGDALGEEEGGPGGGHIRRPTWW